MRLSIVGMMALIASHCLACRIALTLNTDIGARLVAYKDLPEELNGLHADADTTDFDAIAWKPCLPDPTEILDKP